MSKDYKKLYEEALERAKIFKSPFCQHAAEVIFPELRESEDEKIRKALIKYLDALDDDEVRYGVSFKDMRVWLEKRGKQKSIEQDTDVRDLWVYIREWNDKFGRLPKDEDELASCIDYVMKRQKPADKVEPKFKVGDWIVYSRNDSSMEILYVYDIRDGRYYFNDNIHFSWSVKECEEKSHFWTIQDAKDGDVLFTTCDNINEIVFIYHGIELNVANCYFLYSKTNNECKTFNSICSVKADIHPATKEQRDLLFSKMKEAGYEWDAEKKELKKIEPSCYHSDGLYYAIDILEKTFGNVEGYQSDDGKMEHQTAIETVNALYHKKPAWNEKYIADVFEKVGLARIVREQGNDQLTNAVQSAMIELSKHQTSAWSEEDERMCQETIDWFEKKCFPYALESENPARESIKWLKSLKDRVQPRPKQEWSEYDKIQLSEAIQMIEANGTWIRSEDAVKKVSNWLKSIKPQSHWKPSKEQIEALDRAVDALKVYTSYTPLISLLEQLKAL